jgi:carbon-monoxide dehydrogenase small subunit
VNVVVNGVAVGVDGPPQQTLQELIRDTAVATGTPGACGHGVCGACTVLIDGRPARSCLTLARASAGRSVVTVEGLEAVAPAVVPRLREAFLEHHAFQCGYCTSGMLVLAAWWLAADADARAACPDPETLLAANLCRCTGYTGIRRAIERVAVDLGGTP